ncbi:MAG TPA: GNAT family N-acetyltransferase [Acidimicrobiia bacterium]|nr:GNAT family N-acetyltransferase [Acidimicrobiia bacterium]
MPDVRLRPVIESDLLIFFDQQQDDVANHMAAFTPKDPSDRDAFDDRWRRIMADTSLVLRTILLRDEVVGSVSCHRWYGEPEIAYGVARPHWGEGIATAALSMFLEQVSERPLFARVAVDNPGSIRVLEKCGFRLIGVEREFANARGEEVDEAVYRLGEA